VERGPNGKVDMAWARTIAMGSSEPAQTQSPASQDALAAPQNVPGRLRALEA
jgi:hypothetical protein